MGAGVSGVITDLVLSHAGWTGLRLGPESAKIRLRSPMDKTVRGQTGRRQFVLFLAQVITILGFFKILQHNDAFVVLQMMVPGAPGACTVLARPLVGNMC